MWASGPCGPLVGHVRLAATPVQLHLMLRGGTKAGAAAPQEGFQLLNARREVRQRVRRE